jgi:hypothetical protein
MPYYNDNITTNDKSNQLMSLKTKTNNPDLFIYYFYRFVYEIKQVSIFYFCF